MIVVFFAVVAACGPKAGGGHESTTRSAKAELFILPNGYTGPFIAIYDQSGGVVPRWHGDTAVYSTPSTGIVRIALPEPERGSPVLHVFAGDRSVPIKSYRTCEALALNVRDESPQVCWLDFAVVGTGIPNHVIAVVTDSASVARDFDRTTFVYDSVLLGGTGQGVPTWSDHRPKPKLARPRA